VYTPHQIECMKKLGIKFLQAGSLDASPKESLTKDMVLEPLFEKDLLVLFPQMKVVGQKVQLTESFSWLIESKSTRVIATKTQLITAPISDLSSAQKQQVWSTLAPLVSQ